MRSKVLTPTTIIPPHLYVERAADRQLRSIIDEMGRPGYVLVARQMGKTNLLINMKRQRPADVVVYLDLSNQFESARACFRHVIDLTIEAYPDLFGRTANEIARQRSQNGLEPNVEFDRHLRLLLRSTDRRVIVVLDEIDSLLRADYSDSILAQIRSMYFSRVNHPEYNRLTYVLSGVVEPAELIKNGDISPFNIGEKIYLEDFSREEFQVFVGKAQLQLPAQVADAVFHWAGGNPRMTWDICSDAENRMLQGRELEVSDIDDIVGRLYLGELVHTPVDHIRTLVTRDHRIMEAVVAINSGKVNLPDDRMRGRLYLAGITRSPSSDRIEIKNRVIEAALSTKRLVQLDEVRRSILALASNRYKAKNYGDAIRQFEHVLADAAGEDELATSHRVQLGISSFFVGQTARAIQTLQECAKQSEEASELQTVQFYLGAARMAERSYADGLFALKEAAKGPDVLIGLQARVSMVTAYLHMSPAPRLDETLQLSTEVIRELAGFDGEIDLALMTTALYNEARIYSLLGDRQAAERDLACALFHAAPELQPAILSFKYELANDRSEQQALAQEAALCVLKSKLKLVDVPTNTLDLTKGALAKLLVRLKSNDLHDRYEELIDHIVEQKRDDGRSAFGVMLDLFDTFSTDSDRRSAVPLLLSATPRCLDGSVATPDKIRVFRALALYAQSSPAQDWPSSYLATLSTEVAPEAIAPADLLAFYRLISRWNAESDSARLRTFFAAYRRYADKAASIHLALHLTIRVQELAFYREHGPQNAGQDLAGELLAMLRQDEDGELARKLPSLISEIEKHAKYLLTPELSRY